MRFLTHLRGLWLLSHKLDAANQEIATLKQRHGDAATLLAERIHDLTELYRDLVRQVGEQNASANKQLVDLRTVVTQLGEQAKQGPVVARSMADVRRFTGGDED